MNDVPIPKPDDLPPFDEWHGHITVEHYCPNCKTVTPPASISDEAEAAWQVWAEVPEWTYGNRKAAFIAGYGYALDHLRQEFMSAEIGETDA